MPIKVKDETVRDLAKARDTVAFALMKLDLTDFIKDGFKESYVKKLEAAKSNIESAMTLMENWRVKK